MNEQPHKKTDILKGILKVLDQKIEEKKEGEDQKHILALVTQLMATKEIQDSIEASKLTREDIVAALATLKIEPPQVNVTVPEIKMPEIKMPEMKMPEIRVPPVVIPEIRVPPIPSPKVVIPPIHVPEPKVTVNVPPIEIPPVQMPDTMNVAGEVSLRGVDAKNPLPVMFFDLGGKPVSSASFLGGSGGTRTGIQKTREIPIGTADYAPSSSDSTVLESGRIVKASGGMFYGVTGLNSSTSAQYVQIFNATSQPSEGAVPIITQRVGGSSNFSYDAGRFGKYFSTGIVITNSTTPDTKTVGGADCWFNVLFV